jgi:peptidoglycan/LPS O-acetylase OafA/YrhL
MKGSVNGIVIISMKNEQTNEIPRRVSTMTVLGLSLLAIYIPVIIMGIGLFMDRNCAYIRMDFLKAWPLVPGIMVVVLSCRQMPSNTYLLFGGAIVTPLLIAGTVLFGRLGPWWLAVTLFVAFLISCGLAGLAGAMIRA